MSYGSTPPPEDDFDPLPPTRRTWRQRLLLGSGVTVVAAVLVAALVVGYGLYRFGQIGRQDLTLSPSAAGEPRNYLIVGSDDREVVSADDPDAGAFLDGEDEPAGHRSDTIMIARVDPKAGSVDLVSFPRDLWVPIAGETGKERINTAYNHGPQRLVDTIEQNFALEIHHYIEIDFQSFKGIVNAVDGIPMTFHTAMRDRNSGLDVGGGCVVLDGDQALAYTRARHLQYLDEDMDWVTDPTGDLGRISRQQQFMRKVIDRAGVKTSGFDVKALNDLLASTADNLTVDSGLDLFEMVSLARQFRDFRGDQIHTHTLPVEQWVTNGGASVLRLDEIAAQPVFNLFRGLPAQTLPPSMVRLAIENGSGVAGQAGEAEEVFESMGFQVEGTSNAEGVAERTVVRYAPGSQQAAVEVASHVATNARLEEDRSLETGTVVLVTGKDFTTVTEEVHPVDTTMPSSTETSVAEVDEDIIADPIGVVPTESPADTPCG
jgi:polyisoprenyl-teichoic acid--peptidoglycan teichoic acid transferase